MKSQQKSGSDDSLKKFYITTAIAYTNAKPHIGYAMECIQADMLARYHRLIGDDTFYLTGTDEHGTKIMQTAKDQGKQPQAFVDEISVKFRDLKNILNLSNDGFIRTTDDYHLKAAQKLWQKMVDAGDIYKHSYEGLYCVGCEAFVTEKDLIDGMCPHHNKPPVKLMEENYFFRLSKYSDRIKKLIETDELKVIPTSRKHEILSVINEGLKDVSFSRPRKQLEWGIDIPNDPDQVMYVWCDALSNYASGVDYLNESEQFKRFWPSDVHLIGKDILRFHAAYWIGMLMSAELPLPKQIYVHGYITSEGKKMSKSLNNVVDPVETVEKYGVDPLRYYLLKEIPTTDDGDFSKARFETLYGSELANTFGNLVSRVLAMCHKYFEGKVPTPTVKNEIFEQITAQAWAKYDSSIAEFDLKKAVEQVFEYAIEANKYVDTQKPWALAKTDTTKLADVIYTLLEMIRQIGVMLFPYVPETAQKILNNFHLEITPEHYWNQRVWGTLRAGILLEKPEPLFPRLEQETDASKKA